MEDKTKKSHGKFAIIIKLFIIATIIIISFLSGIFLADKSEITKAIAEKKDTYLGAVTNKYNLKTRKDFSKDIDFSLFWDTWDALKHNYVDQEKVNDKKLFYGALKGMVAAVGDPYTVFMEPKTAQEFSDDLAGTFEGIGAEIGIKKDILTIIAPLPDMPAAKAGVKAGDLVLAIDKQSTMGISIDEAVNKLRGPKNTDVTITISRKGMEGTKDIVITRGKIIVKSVRTSVKEDNIFVIKITSFNEDTYDLFGEAEKKALSSNAKGIILDLRNNPGGFLNTAIEISSEWIEDGVVVEEKFGNGETNPHLARGRARLKDIPTVVLVNQGSASASEIVSGALQDYKKAIIVGMQTFGKGSVQTLTDLGDGSSVKITVAKWLTPNGRSINDEGIAPDVKVDLTLDDYNNNVDPQMDKALEILNNHLSLEDVKKASSTPIKGDLDKSATSTDRGDINNK